MTWPTIATLSLIIFWLSLAFLLTHWPRSRNKSISQHSASNKQAYRFFTTVQVVIGFILYLFIIKWFIPTFNPPFIFTIVYSITAWLQIISAFIPDTVTGRKSRVHQYLANGFALGIFLSALILCFTPAIQGLAKAAIVGVTLYLAYGTTLAISIGGRPERFHNYLRMQVLYIVLFQVAVLFITLWQS